MKFFEVVKSFFKVGAIGFGGGTALIPVVEKECVDEKHMMSREQFQEELVLQGLTPGAFPIKMGVGIGLGKSPLCAAAAAYSTTAVGFIAVLVIMALLSVIGDEAVRQIGFLSVGISAFILVLIYKFVAKTIRQGKDFSLTATLVLFCFVVLFGINSKLEGLIGLFTAEPIKIGIPELSTIDMLLLGLGISVFTGLKYEKTPICIAKYVFSVAVAVFFTLSGALNPVIKLPILKYVLYGIIGVMALAPFAYEIFASLKEQRHKVKTPESEERSQRDKKLIRYALTACVIFVIPPALSAVVCLFLPFKGDLGGFVLNGVLSTVTTFGGGTAFISTAEAMFAGSFVSADFYWVQTVAISNALPGPLLVKMLSSIGYGYVTAAGGGIGSALAYGITGGLVGVSTTAIVYLLVYTVFLKLKTLGFFVSLKRGIMPIIAGLLVSTMASMLKNAANTGIGARANVYAALAVIAVFTAGSALLSGKTKLKDPYIILLCAAVSSAVFNMFYYIR